MNTKTKNTLIKTFSWLLFILTSLFLFVGYYSNNALHDPHLEPGLKDLNLIQHFGIHYVTGIFYASIALNIYLLLKRKILNEPLILTLFVFLSHFPDIKTTITGLPHQGWEVIFLLHTLVDDKFSLFWILLFLNLILGYYYLSLIKQPR